VKFTQASAPTRSMSQARFVARGVSLAVAVLAALPAAAGCQANGAGNPNAGAPTQLTVAAIPGVDTAPLFIAKNDGAFARAGLAVTIHSYQSFDQELLALAGGRVNVLAGDYADFFYQQTRGYKSLRVIADGYHSGPGVAEILAAPGSGIMSPADLVGKTIGTAEPIAIPYTAGEPYSLETFAAQSVLTSDGVDPKTITWKPMPAKNLIAALGTHKVAAILVSEPYIIQAESELGATAVLDAFSGATANLPLSGYFASAPFVQTHRDAISAFRTVLEQAQAAAVLPGPVRAQLAGDPGMTALTASLVTIGAYPTALDVAGLQRVADLMFGYGMLLPPELTVASIIAGR
jgi:NitT/TauT family transport system substrate-binding protein